MKRLLLLTACVLAVCIGICAASQLLINPVLEEAHGLSVSAQGAMEAGDPVRAKELLVALATLWEEKSGMMEIFCDHDDLHGVKENIILAEICLESDQEDFFAYVSLVGEGVEHICDEEATRWINLL